MALRSMNQLDSETVVRVPLDLRGWEARTRLDDEKAGSVHDVLVDEQGAARYLDVDLGVFRKHVLVPVGQAVTDATRDVVWLEALDSDGLKEIPGYTHGADRVTPAFEERLTTSYDETTRSRRYFRPEYGGIGLEAAGANAQTVDPTITGTEHVRLRRLGELNDYEVADDDPDPRGWQVISAEGEKIGEVDELVVDPQALKTRYLEVELDRSVARDDADHALIPVGFARLDEEERRVRLPALEQTDMLTLPRYRDEFDESYEDSVERHFAQRFRGAARYRHPRFESDRLYAARGVPQETEGGGRICDVRIRR